jgi:hypothetical protein
MKNTSFTDKGDQYAWDATSLTSAQRCMRYYYYNIVEGYQPRGKSVHLLFGGWYASALEHYHIDRTAGLSHKEAMHKMVRETLIETWQHARDEDGKRVEGTGLPWKATDRYGQPESAKSREGLIRSLIWYVETFEHDDLETYITSDGKPAVEHTFKLPVDGDIIFAGHLDRLTVKNGDPFVTDNKTTSAALGPYYFDQFKTDGQMSMYTYAGSVIFSMPVKGVIIDAAQVGVTFTRFSRNPTLRTKGQLNEWYDNTMYTIETARHLAREKYFPMNLASCGNYGGCPFRSVCGRDPAVRPNILKGDFQKRIWDPLVER